MPAAVDYGKKWICYSCATKFYDLKKAKAVCPKCGADQASAPPPDADKGLKKKPPVAKVVAKPAAKVAAKPVAGKRGADDEEYVPEEADEEEDEDFALTSDDEKEEEEEEAGDDDEDDDS